MASGIKKKISWRDVAIGAIGIVAIMCVPTVGDTLATGVGKIRDKISGR